MDQLGQKLKEHREAKGIKQQEMADILGIGRRTYQSIENNGEIKKVAHLVAILQQAPEVAQIFTHVRINSVDLVPGQNASLEELVIALRELRFAAEKIQKRIDDLALRGKGSSAAGSLEDLEKMGSGSKMDKSGKD